MTTDEIAATIRQLQEQQALQTQGLIAILEGRYAGGANTLDGYVHALNPDFKTEPKVPIYAD